MGFLRSPSAGVQASDLCWRPSTFPAFVLFHVLVRDSMYLNFLVYL